MSNQQKKYKIALVGDCLALGGAEKVMAILSIYFDKNNLEVLNCILVDKVSYDYAGNLLNLGKIKPNSCSIIRKIYRFCALVKFIKNNQFDAVIDFRMRQNQFLEFMLSWFIYPPNSIYTVHSGVLGFYFPTIIFFSRLIYNNKKIVSVSDGIKNKIELEKFVKSAITIHNPFDFSKIAIQKNEFLIDENYILAVGNMNNDIKQFDKLICKYAKSDLPKKNIKLFILGDGILKVKYLELVKSLKLNDLIFFKGISDNPFPYYKNALFLVSCSKYEGLPNVIIESLACETPVIAFDCFSGPKEIIVNNQNGLLIENQNFEKLIEAMNFMISNTDFYKKVKKNARKSVEKFSVEIIGKQWLEFI